MARIGSRFCINGHDKDVTGRHGRACLVCHEEQTLKSYHRRRTLGPGTPRMKTGPKESPTCRRGHVYADVGRDSGGTCRGCRDAAYKKAAASGAHRRRMRDQELAKYGITQDIYDSIAALQRGRCAICELTPTPIKGKKAALFVDHDHESGMVRGLLCHACNVTLGLMKDSAHRLRMAAAYLDENYSEGRWPPPEDT